MCVTPSRLAILLSICISFLPSALLAPAYGQSSAPSSSAAKTSPTTNSQKTGIDSGSASNDIYHDKTFGFSCKIPAGWVVRTDEMNARDDDSVKKNGPPENALPQRTQGNTEGVAAGRVLLAAFSRPPEAHGEDVNSSILIAAESAAAYPGLKEASQYFGPLTEVAEAQGFEVDEEPYEYVVGTKTLVRGDFHKDVGARVMHQSTLAMLSHGYAVSITVIGGTEDEVEELIDGLEFVTGKK
jgi:hypothetical protein